MGKLHSLRRAILRNPEKFRNRDGTPAQWRGKRPRGVGVQPGEWFASWNRNRKSFQGFIDKVLKISRGSPRAGR
jgi:hypothetical protein